MTVYDAQPNDVYADENGKLWRVVGIIGEPSIVVQEIEPSVSGLPVKRNGGVSGCMWNGWRRIFRPEQRQD